MFEVTYVKSSHRECKLVFLCVMPLWCGSVEMKHIFKCHHVFPNSVKASQDEFSAYISIIKKNCWACWTALQSSYKCCGAPQRARVLKLEIGKIRLKDVNKKIRVIIALLKYWQPLNFIWSYCSHPLWCIILGFHSIHQDLVEIKCEVELKQYSETVVYTIFIPLFSDSVLKKMERV